MSLVASFVTPRLEAAPDLSSEAPSAVLDAAVDVEGRGLFSAIGCMGCIGGGVILMSGGSTLVLAAVAAEGSAIAAATCLALCREAIASAW